LCIKTAEEYIAMDPRSSHEASMQWLYVVASAAVDAKSNDCRWIGAEHFLFAIISHEKWPGNNQQIMREIRPYFPDCKKATGNIIPTISPKLKAVIAIATTIGEGTVSPLSVLIALLETKKALGRKIKEVLVRHGLTAETARAEYQKRYI
jgi:hypothetical protein